MQTTTRISLISLAVFLTASAGVRGAGINLSPPTSLAGYDLAYGDDYSFAAAMMSAPLFFTETRRYSPADRAALKHIIAVYTQHRAALYAGYVFSVGDLPGDASWTGFQNYHPDKTTGYLTLFRGIDNRDSEKGIRLRFLKGQRLRLENLMTGEFKIIAVDAKGEAFFQIDAPGAVRLFKYEVLSK